MGKRDFVFDWVKALRFKKNPFHIDVPKNVDKFFTGCAKERQKINLFILERYRFGTVSGPEGSGKTNLLKWVDEKLKSHKDKVKVAYIDSAALGNERDLIETLCTPLLNIYERTVSKTHKKLMLQDIGKFLYSKLKGKSSLLILLDDVGSLPKRYVPLFKYLFNQKINLQMIVSGKKKELEDSGITSISEKDNLALHLKSLSYEECLWLVEKRIKHYGGEGIFPFQKDMMKKLYDSSEGNPKNFLVECKEKAIKLSLDDNYMKREFQKLEAQRQREIEEIEEDGDKKVISISFGKSEPRPRKKDSMETLSAPKMKDQEEILAELVKKEKVGQDMELPEELVGSDDKEDNKELEETDKFLAKLAEEFEED